MARPPKPDPVELLAHRPKPHEHGVMILSPSNASWRPSTFAEQAAHEFERSVAGMRGRPGGDVPVAVRLVQRGTVVDEERFQLDWPR